MSSATARAAVIGLGSMGYGMAQSLVRAGFEVVGCDVSAASMARFKAEGGEVFFWDESGFRADTVHGKTWGRKGHTPIVERPGQRQSISAASGVNPAGRSPVSSIAAVRPAPAA